LEKIVAQAGPRRWKISVRQEQGEANCADATSMGTPLLGKKKSNGEQKTPKLSKGGERKRLGTVEKGLRVLGGGESSRLDGPLGR